MRLSIIFVVFNQFPFHPVCWCGSGLDLFHRFIGAALFLFLLFYFIISASEQAIFIVLTLTLIFATDPCGHGRVDGADWWSDGSTSPCLCRSGGRWRWYWRGFHILVLVLGFRLFDLLNLFVEQSHARWRFVWHEIEINGGEGLV
jgi:hypothetical protein